MNASHQAHPFSRQSPMKRMNPMIPKISAIAPIAIKKIPKNGIARPARMPIAPEKIRNRAAISCKIAMIVTPSGRSANFFTNLLDELLLTLF